jgi:hypothetical protein
MKAFTVAITRDILDQYDRSEISYSRMVELLNERFYEVHTELGIALIEKIKEHTDGMDEIERKDYFNMIVDEMKLKKGGHMKR